MSLRFKQYFIHNIPVLQILWYSSSGTFWTNMIVKSMCSLHIDIFKNHGVSLQEEELELLSTTVASFISEYCCSKLSVTVLENYETKEISVNRIWLLVRINQDLNDVGFYYITYAVLVYVTCNCSIVCTNRLAKISRNLLLLFFCHVFIFFVITKKY